MPIESNDFTTFVEWFPSALGYWAVVVACLLVASILIGLLVASLRHGPREGLRVTGKALVALAVDITRISPRRVGALAWLSVKEAIRRRVVVVFVVFLVIMLFAGWFINPGSDHPARLYLGYVVFPTTTLLMLAMALFLSALSLPLDIRNRTLHTVVTKPVRQSEIVLGRILGITAVGTMLLVPMGVINYVFTVRGLQHRHELTASDLEDAGVSRSGAPRKKGETREASHHRHKIVIGPETRVRKVVGGEEQVFYRTEPANGHTHLVQVEESESGSQYRVLPSDDLLAARVPVYAKDLRFLDRGGEPATRGINVGDEWTYRSFIDGNPGPVGARAIWEFDGITPDRFPEYMDEFKDGIPLELTLEVFRTHKGVMGQGVWSCLRLRNPDDPHMAPVKVMNFQAKKFDTDVHVIPRKIRKLDKDGNEVHDAEGHVQYYDLFRDLVSRDGRVEVWLQCMDRGQCLGMAQADAYFRARDASFAANFAKGHLGVWLQMVLVIGFGVVFSTFLSAPVAFLATLGAIVGGTFNTFMNELAMGKVVGGGPFESFLRLLTQQNQVSDLEPGLRAHVAQMSDMAVRPLLRLLSTVLPGFGDFDFSTHVAYGFDVGGDMLLKCLFRVVAFLLPLVVAGYFFLKTREVAR